MPRNLALCNGYKVKTFWRFYAKKVKSYPQSSVFVRFNRDDVRFLFGGKVQSFPLKGIYKFRNYVIMCFCKFFYSKELYHKIEKWQLSGLSIMKYIYLNNYIIK